MRRFLSALPWVFLVAAVAAVGWLAWEVSDSLWGPAEPQARATTSTTTTTQAPGTTTTTIPDARSAWAPVDGEGGTFGGPGIQAISSVAAGGPGLVAVGHGNPNGDADGLVWVSADGSAWALLDLEETVFGGPGDQVVSSVAAGGPGLVAVGHDVSGGDADGAVWVSADGSAWILLDAAEAGFGGPGVEVLSLVAPGGPGLVALGYRYEVGETVEAAAWVSADGYLWARSSDTALGGAGDEKISAVVAAGPGLVAVGSDSSGGDEDAAVWVSADGLDWTRIPHDEAVFGGPGIQEMSAVVAGGPGLVAVGSDGSGGDGDGAVWVSASGYLWVRLDVPSLGGPGRQALRAVAAGSLGLVAAGVDSSRGNDDGAVWISADGYTWGRLLHDEAVFGGPGRQEIGLLATGRAGLIAVGSVGMGGDDDAAVWLSHSLG